MVRRWPSEGKGGKRGHLVICVRSVKKLDVCPPSDWGSFSRRPGNIYRRLAATAGSDVVQSGRPIFDDFFQHLWPHIGNNTANVVFQMVKRLWLIRIEQ
ncbi:hypothetical protein TNCV_934361 [Trichonephila clavipes]|nr:hypothetical protein TNCV_934361 [Trichonephila clavipes]